MASQLFQIVLGASALLAVAHGIYKAPPPSSNLHDEGLLGDVIVLGVSALVAVAHGDNCKAPAPSSNFTMKGYSGMWYEVGKVQTAEGAYFGKDTVCTTIDVQPVSGSATGDATAVISCRKDTPTGQLLNATGSLTDQVTPGKWKEGFFARGTFDPKVDYTVIYLDAEFAIEYDCSTILGLNYCIHIMARHPAANQTRVTELLDFAEKQLGLNTDNVPFQPTKQDGCW